MKLNTAVAKSLLMAASIGMVVPLVAQTAPQPVKPAKPAKAPTEEPAKIPGIEIPRQNGTFIGVTVDGVRLVLKFYDADKQPVAVDVASAFTRWLPTTRKGEVRTLLKPDDTGKALVSPPVALPPLNFTAYVTLLDANDKTVEFFSVDLRKLGATKAE